MYYTLVLQEHDFKLVPNSQFHDHSGSQTAASIAQVDNKPKDGGASTNELGELKKLDSFGRWMDKEIGGDCDDSLMASDSGNYWNTLGTENEDKEVSSLSHHMQLDIESLGPSLSQEQLFSIILTKKIQSKKRKIQMQNADKRPELISEELLLVLGHLHH